PTALEPRERTRRSLVQQEAVDVEERLAAGALRDHVPIPDFLEQGLEHDRTVSPSPARSLARALRPQTVMGATIRLFRIGRSPVYIHASWIAIYALITWTLAVGYFPRMLPGIDAGEAWSIGLLGALLLFVSLLLHELAHCLVAVAHGLRVRGITLHV